MKNLLKVDAPAGAARHSAHYSMILRTNCIPPRPCRCRRDQRRNFLLRSVGRAARATRHGWAGSCCTQAATCCACPRAQRRAAAGHARRQAALRDRRPVSCTPAGHRHHHTVAETPCGAGLEDEQSLAPDFTARFRTLRKANGRGVPGQAQNIQALSGKPPIRTTNPQGNGLYSI